MSSVVTDPSRAALVEAIEGNFVEQMLLAAALPEAVSGRGPDCAWYLTGAPVARMNAVLRAAPSPGGDQETVIDELLAMFDARAVPVEWWTLPSSRAARLTPRLERRGFAPGPDWPGMAVDLHALQERPTPAGVAIQQVADAATLGLWLDAFRHGFRVPRAELEQVAALYELLGTGEDAPIRHYLGTLKGDPVATSSLFVAAGVAGIYNVSSIPRVRGRGIGAAMTQHPLREARAMGYRIGVLEASDMGAGVYRRLGFRQYCRLRGYVRPAPGPSAPATHADAPVAHAPSTGHPD